MKFTRTAWARLKVQLQLSKLPSVMTMGTSKGWSSISKTGPASQAQTSRYCCWANRAHFYCLYWLNFSNITINRVYPQAYFSQLLLQPKSLCHHFTLASVWMIWLREDLATSNLKWFWWQNAPCASGFCTGKWHKVGRTAPEVPRPRSLSISSATTHHLLLPSPGCTISTHYSKCSLLLKDELTFLTVFYIMTLMFRKLPFKKFSRYTPIGIQVLRMEVSYWKSWTWPTRSQKQSPEPPPPQSPIYGRTETAEGRLSMENVVRTESKRAKAPSAHFIDSLFNEEINR